MLSDHSNVYNTAIRVLEKRGYQLWYDSEIECFCAEKDGWDFNSPTPTGLLGLVSIFEATKPVSYKEYWWRDEGDLTYTSLPSASRPYSAVGSKHK